MSSVPRNEIPKEIFQDSVLAHPAAAYFSVGKRLERKTECSATRGFILSTSCDGTALNQKQIATLLGFDRTIVHRSVKSLAQEGLVSEHPENRAALRARSGMMVESAPRSRGWLAIYPEPCLLLLLKS